MSILDKWTQQNADLAEKLEVLEAVAEAFLKLAQNDE